MYTVRKAEKVTPIVNARGKTLNRVNLNVVKESDKEFVELWPLIKEVLQDPKAILGGLVCGAAVVMVFVLGAML